MRKYSKEEEAWKNPIVAPPRVLMLTLNYLLSEILPLERSLGTGKPLEINRVRGFLFDRLRMMAKDIQHQNYQYGGRLDAFVMQMLEHMVRTLILLAYESSFDDVFRVSQRKDHEEKGITGILTLLLELYLDARERSRPGFVLVSPCEAEFRAYKILLSLDTLRLADNRQILSTEIAALPSPILRSEPVKFALACVSVFLSGNSARFFSLFKSCPDHLNAAILMRVVPHMQQAGLRSAAGAQPKRAPAADGSTDADGEGLPWRYLESACAIPDAKAARKFAERYDLPVSGPHNDLRIVLRKDMTFFEDKRLLEFSEFDPQFLKAVPAKKRTVMVTGGPAGTWAQRNQAQAAFPPRDSLVAPSSRAGVFATDLSTKLPTAPKPIIITRPVTNSNVEKPQTPVVSVPSSSSGGGAKPPKSASLQPATIVSLFGQQPIVPSAPQRPAPPSPPPSFHPAPLVVGQQSGLFVSQLQSAPPPVQPAVPTHFMTDARTVQQPPFSLPPPFPPSLPVETVSISRSETEAAPAAPPSVRPTRTREWARDLRDKVLRDASAAVDALGALALSVRDVEQMSVSVGDELKYKYVRFVPAVVRADANRHILTVEHLASAVRDINIADAEGADVAESEAAAAESIERVAAMGANAPAQQLLLADRMKEGTDSGSGRERARLSPAASLVAASAYLASHVKPWLAAARVALRAAEKSADADTRAKASRADASRSAEAARAAAEHAKTSHATDCAMKVSRVLRFLAFSAWRRTAHYETNSSTSISTTLRNLPTVAPLFSSSTKRARGGLPGFSLGTLRVSLPAQTPVSPVLARAVAATLVDLDGDTKSNSGALPSSARELLARIAIETEDASTIEASVLAAAAPLDVARLVAPGLAAGARSRSGAQAGSAMRAPALFWKAHVSLQCASENGENVPVAAAAAESWLATKLSNRSQVAADGRPPSPPPSLKRPRAVNEAAAATSASTPPTVLASFAKIFLDPAALAAPRDRERGQQENGADDDYFDDAGDDAPPLRLVIFIGTSKGLCTPSVQSLSGTQSLFFIVHCAVAGVAERGLVREGALGARWSAVRARLGAHLVPLAPDGGISLVILLVLHDAAEWSSADGDAQLEWVYGEGSSGGAGARGLIERGAIDGDGLNVIASLSATRARAFCDAAATALRLDALPHSVVRASAVSLLNPLCAAVPPSAHVGDGARALAWTFSVGGAFLGGVVGAETGGISRALRASSRDGDGGVGPAYTSSSALAAAVRWAAAAADPQPRTARVDSSALMTAVTGAALAGVGADAPPARALAALAAAATAAALILTPPPPARAPTAVVWPFPGASKMLGADETCEDESAIGLALQSLFAAASTAAADDEAAEPPASIPLLSGGLAAIVADAYAAASIIIRVADSVYAAHGASEIQQPFAPVGPGEDVARSISEAHFALGDCPTADAFALAAAHAVWPFSLQCILRPRSRAAALVAVRVDAALRAWALAAATLVRADLAARMPLTPTPCAPWSAMLRPLFFACAEVAADAVRDLPSPTLPPALIARALAAAAAAAATTPAPSVTHPAAALDVGALTFELNFAATAVARIRAGSFDQTTASRNTTAWQPTPVDEATAQREPAHDSTAKELFSVLAARVASERDAANAFLAELATAATEGERGDTHITQSSFDAVSILAKPLGLEATPSDDMRDGVHEESDIWALLADAKALVAGAKEEHARLNEMLAFANEGLL